MHPASAQGGPPPVVVRLRSARTLVNLVLGVVVVLGGGLASIVAAVVGGYHSTGETAVGWIVGVLLALLGVVLLAGTVASFRDRRIVFDTTGVHWVEPGKGWTVRWDQLRRASVRYALHRRGGRRGGYRIHLELVLLDASHSPLPPQLHRLYQPIWGGGPGTIGVPLGTRRELVEPLARGIATFGGTRNGGVIDDGERAAPGYAPRPT